MDKYFHLPNPFFYCLSTNPYSLLPNPYSLLLLIHLYKDSYFNILSYN